jgi:hypothetical protein
LRAGRRGDPAGRTVTIRDDGVGMQRRSVRLLRPGAAVSPLAAPDAQIAVADLIP